MSVRELADIDESRIELINEFEVKVTEYRRESLIYVLYLYV
jgi:hypothetical protein